MHFARLVQHVLKSVLGLHRPLRLHIRLHLLTASCSPLILLILDSGHLPTATLSIRLLSLPLPIILLVVVVVVVLIVLAVLSPTEPLVSCLSCLRSPLCLDDTADAELNGTHCRVRDSKRVGTLHELGQ